MSIKLLKYFLFLAVTFLTLSFPFSIKAQTPSTPCGKGYKMDLVRDLVQESETVYNRSTGFNETRTVWNWKYVWKCVPTPPETNSTTSKDKKPNASNSKVIPNAKVKPSLGLHPPYAGQYSGKWITTYSDSVKQKGEWTLFVDKNGKITGEEVNTTFDVTADINGFVSEDGYIELSFKYGGIFKDTPPALMKGSITNAENRHLKGTLNQYRGDKITTTIEIDLAPIDAR